MHRTRLQGITGQAQADAGRPHEAADAHVLAALPVKADTCRAWDMAPDAWALTVRMPGDSGGRGSLLWPHAARQAPRRIVLAPETVLPVPAHLDDASAARLALDWTRVWNALARRAALRADEAVLIHDAHTLPGRLAIHLAIQLGASPMAMARTADDFPALFAAGAVEVMRYTDPWPQLLREHGGVDVVLDPGDGARLDPSLTCASAHARLVLLGQTVAPDLHLDLPRLLAKGVSIIAASWSPQREAHLLAQAAVQFKTYLQAGRMPA
ncbi:zinc-binding dehydrogenase [Verticiella sediminum]|nr:zinc-binding dehydrogenase [Verticiella sediminum]